MLSGESDGRRAVFPGVAGSEATGWHPPYDDHVKLMFDLQVLAYQTDMTRVTTFMMAREKSDIVYTQLGHTEPHHPISHNRGRRDLIVLKEQIDTHHAKLFAYFPGEDAICA